MLIALITLALVATWVTAGIGRRLGLVDTPDARKQHLGDIPLTGGIAIFITLLIGTAVLAVPPFTYEMLIIACVIFAIGVYDDYSHLNPGIRLTIQYGSGILLATYGGIAIHSVGDLLAMGEIPLLLLSVPLTALSVAGLTNAYNMVDGIDGLAAATLGLPLLVLFLLALSSAHPMADSLLMILIPSALFLCFNLGPNTRFLPKIFLGDGGSITVGFLVTASLVYFSQGETALIRPVTALWLVTVPLMDMLATMLRRLKSRRKLMEADRSHLHYSLIDMGLGSRQTLTALLAYAGMCSVAGLALEQAPESVSLLCYFLLFIAHCTFVIHRDEIAQLVRGKKHPETDSIEGHNSA